jgi:hypothetical protein
MIAIFAIKSDPLFCICLRFLYNGENHDFDVDFDLDFDLDLDVNLDMDIKP